MLWADNLTTFMCRLPRNSRSPNHAQCLCVCFYTLLTCFVGGFGNHARSWSNALTLNNAKCWGARYHYSPLPLNISPRSCSSASYKSGTQTKYFLPFSWVNYWLFTVGNSQEMSDVTGTAQCGGWDCTDCRRWVWRFVLQFSLILIVHHLYGWCHSICNVK